MTPRDERRAAQAERARTECVEQGLPEHVEDPASLARLAVLLAPTVEESDPKEAA